MLESFIYNHVTTEAMVFELPDISKVRLVVEKG